MVLKSTISYSSQVGVGVVTLPDRRIWSSDESVVAGESMPHSVVLVYFVLTEDSLVTDSHPSHLHIRGYTLPPFLRVITTYLHLMLDCIPMDLMVSYCFQITFNLYMPLPAVPLSPYISDSHHFQPDL